MFLRECALLLIGLSAGGIIAAGVFAFLAMIGVFPRLMGRTRTGSHIFLYETAIILGGIAGNVMDLYEIPFPFGAAGSGIPFWAMRRWEYSGCAPGFLWAAW